jgi:hypothetical protein
LHVPSYLLMWYYSISNQELTLFSVHLFTFPFHPYYGLHFFILHLFLQTPTFDVGLVLLWSRSSVSHQLIVAQSRYEIKT